MGNFRRKIYVTLLLAASMVLWSACTKDFLDTKRDKSQVAPVALEDYRAILDETIMNFSYPYLLGEIGSGDYFISLEHWQSLSNPVHKNAYIWADDVYQGERGEDWNRAYEKILYANFVLEGVGEIEESPANKQLRDELIGAAHFYRGTNFFLIAQLFCKQYDHATAHETLGLPLRITSNINSNYQRATLEETYIQIIADFKKAALLLPQQMSVNTRPSGAAAFGMLANVYLQMADFQSAFSNADIGLSLASDLLDYNEVNVETNVPFPLYGQGNKEIVFYSQMDNSAIFSVSRLNVDKDLFDSYSEYDLRRETYFRINNGINTFKGHYSGISAFMFSGLTTAEMLLVRAECNARLGHVEDAVADLNLLLSNRFKQNYFAPISDIVSQNELLHMVLSERRKELVFRGRRWHDLKRFGKDPALAQSLTRILGEELHTLPSNSLKWVWPLPPDAIGQGKIIQNER